jgi:hypothetical protein
MSYTALPSITTVTCQPITANIRSRKQRTRSGTRRTAVTIACFNTSRTEVAATRNQNKFLLQTYRRDMGGGNFVLMKDLSAPIWVNGKHWGALRVGYQF